MLDMKNDEGLASEQIAGRSNTPLMWMHLTWLPSFLPVVPYIIWKIVEKKNSQAGTHFRNILNASLTLVIFHALAVFSMVGMLFVLVSSGFIEGTVDWFPSGFVVHTPNPIPGILFFTVYMSVLVCVIVSIIKVSMAARKGKTLPYWWAIRFRWAFRFFGVKSNTIEH